MNFKEEVLAHFLDDEQLVSRDRDPSHWSGGNQLLDTSIFYVLLKLKGDLTDEDRLRFENAVDACWVRNESGVPILGLLDRNPGRSDFEAHDDYRGICVASYFLKTNHARAVRDYGKKHWWVFNNRHPGRLNEDRFGDAFFGRLPGFSTLVGVCAVGFAGFLDKHILNCIIQGACDELGKNNSNDILNWLVVVLCKDLEILPEDCAKWDLLHKSRYGTIGNMFAKVYGSEHPFSTFN